MSGECNICGKWGCVESNHLKEGKMNDIKKEFEEKGWNNDRVIKLLPCPFCGGEPELLHIGNDFKPKKRITIRCKKCRVERTEACLRHDFKWLEDVASKNWNNRSWIEQKLSDKNQERRSRIEAKILSYKSKKEASHIKEEKVMFGAIVSALQELLEDK